MSIFSRSGSAPFNAARFLVLIPVVLLTFNVSATRVAAFQDNAAAKPSKATMIANLKTIVKFIEEKKYDEASQFFFLPPGFKPEMMSMLVDNKEISSGGVAVLEKSAKFAAGGELYSETRLTYLAEKYSADKSKSYGFLHKTKDAEAEVLGEWSGTSFKFFAMDNVGKLSPVNEAAPVDLSPVLGGMPDKATLIKSLRYFHSLLKQARYAEAAQLINVPKDFAVEKLAGTIERNELSENGIDVLERDAIFGSVKERFPERGEALVERTGMNIDECFGFRHTAGGQTGEVIAHWNGKMFRLLRVDDVAKIAKPDGDSKREADPQPSVAAKPSQAPAAKSQAPVPLKMTKEEVLAKLGQWIAAVDNNPKNPLARTTLAMAQYRVGNTPAAWRQLVEANKLAPNTVGIERGLGVVFAAFRDQNIFTVGVPQETIESLLGEPDQKVDLEDKKKRYVYAFYAVDFAEGRVHRTADLRVPKGSQPGKNSTEIVKLDLPLSWICIYRHNTATTSTAVFVPAGQSMSQWKAKFEIRRFKGVASQVTVKSVVDQMSRQILAAHPESKQNVLESDDDSAIVTNRIPASEGVDTQFQLVRFLLGKDDVHRIGVYMKKDKLAEEIQQTWLKIFRDAKRANGE